MTETTLKGDLSEAETARYRRQISLPQIGSAGQQRLKGSSVLIIGAGGLGAPAALYLAGAGIGRLGIVDYDRVEESNLHRQVLYRGADVGERKAEVARQRLRDLNPYVEIEAHPLRLAAENAQELIQGYDVVLDGTDAFSSRYVVNDACVFSGVPNVSASVSQFEGQVSVYAAPGGPCYRCIFGDPPPAHLVPSCADGGVLGVLPGLLGVVQATEAIKLLLGIGEPLVGRLLLVDTLGMHFRTLHFNPDLSCPACGEAPRKDSLSHSLTSRPPSSMASVPEITVREYERLRDRDEPPFLLDVRRQEEYEIANLDGALIPLDELPNRLGELEAHRDDDVLVVHCRSGARSARAVEFLHQHGFKSAVNLRGGILAWSDEVDPSVPKY